MSLSLRNQHKIYLLMYQSSVLNKLWTCIPLVLLVFALSSKAQENKKDQVQRVQDEGQQTTGAEAEATDSEKKARGAELEAAQAEKEIANAEQEAGRANQEAEEKRNDEAYGGDPVDNESEETTNPLVTGQRDEDALVVTTDVVSSRLKKMDLAGPAPEIRISVEQIFASGQTSIADFLRDNPVSAFGSTRESSGLSSGAGAAAVDLRGLGEANTLVLINGVRFPPSSGGDVVDINRIPLAIVKEIVVIKDDLSSIYGSDSIGGVINIITQKEFDGFQVNVGATQTTLGGGEKFDLNLLAGASSAKSNVTFALNYTQKQNIFARERAWSKDNIIELGNPGSYRDVGEPFSPSPQCDPDDFLVTSSGTFCSYNAGDQATTLPEIDQLAIFTHLDHKFSDFTRVYSEFFYNRSITNYVFAPAPGFFTIPAAVADTFALPNHTSGNDMDIGFRATPLGNRDSSQETNFFGLSSGLVHEFFDTWSVTLAGSYGRDRSESVNLGNAVKSQLVDLIGTDVAGGQFNPFAPLGAQGSLDAASYTPTATQIANFYTADLKFSGELGEIFGAPYVLDMGFNYIKRDYTNTVDKLSERAETLTGAGSNGSAERDIYAVYGQLNGRLSKSVDVYLSGRYDKFSDFGDTFNPKLGIKFRPTSDLMFRSTVGTGFKAPALFLLYQTRSDGFERFIDNVACDRDGPGSTSCDPNQYRVVSGGNEDLDAITSFSYSAGFVYEPSNLFDISLDFWAVDQEGLIAGGTPGTLFEATQAELLGIDPSTVGFQMNRDINGNLDQTNPIVAPLVNLIDQKSAGLDLGINYKLGLPLGTLIFSEAASFRLWQEAIPFPGLDSRDDVTAGLVPKWRNQFSVAYKLLSNDLRLSVVSTDKFKGADRATYVDSYSRFDLSYNYSGIEDTNLTLGVINLLGTTPPLDSSNPNDPFSPGLFSQRGPEVFMRLSRNF